jgi:hypothetical protein
MLSAAAQTQRSVTLAWDPSSGTNIAGYNLYYGSASNTYTNWVAVANIAQGTVTGLNVGATYYFTVTAFDASGLESDYSNEVAYTVPVGGSYNVTVPAHGMLAIANQLNRSTNMLSALIPTAPAGSAFYKYTGAGGYAATTYDDLAGAWDRDFSLNPGEAAIFRNASASPFVITFVGEVLQGQLVNTLPIGNSLRSSMVPQSGRITADLGLPAEGGDTIYIYNGTYSGNTFDDISGRWDSPDPGGPIVNVGQGFFYRKAPGGTKTLWIRNFTLQ